MQTDLPMVTLHDQVERWEYNSAGKNCLEITYLLDYNIHHYLKHHMVSNVPVMPQIYLIELIFEIIAKHMHDNDLTLNIYDYAVKNINPVRLIKVHPGTITRLYLILEFKDNNNLIIIKTSQDICNASGEVKRKNIFSFQCEITKIKKKEKWDYLNIYQEKPDWNKDYGKEKVYKLTQNPYGPLMQTKTGEYKWYKNENAIIGGSLVNIKKDQYLAGINSPVFIIPLLECDAGIQHIPFYGMLTGQPGIPENIGNIYFFSHAGENCEILTCVKKNEDFYNVQLFDKKDFRVIAQFEKCHLKYYDIPVDREALDFNQ